MNFPSVSALVFGDVMLDRYLEGTTTRISPEAPVPVVSLKREWSSPGGAGHVAACLAGLGCAVTLGGSIGPGATGIDLRERLRESGIAELALAEHPEAGVICKTRVLAGWHQQLLRLDHDGNRPGLVAAAEELERIAFPLIGRRDVVVVSDYDKGTLPDALVRKIIRECARLRRPCIVDPKKTDLSVYAGATILAPNLHEAEKAIGCTLDSDDAVAAAAAELRNRHELVHMLITRGSEGMTLATHEGVFHFPAQVREVADVTGAGDTVVAALSASLALGWDIRDACRLSSLAAGIAVGKMGTYVVHSAELEQAWYGGSPKILDRQTLCNRVVQARHAGRKVIFTNGCFDILHAGHLSCLSRAKQLGDLLIVGLNSDSSVRMNKGPLRPMIPDGQCAALLAGLACVDYVVIFEEQTPEDLIRHLKPDMLVKGEDYDPLKIAGADYVRSLGGRVVTLPLVDGLSTTAILSKEHTYGG